MTKKKDLKVTSKITPEKNNDGEGAINLKITGGTPPYTYKWSDNSSDCNRTQLQAGAYEVIVTDTDGNTAAASPTVPPYPQVPPPPDARATTPPGPPPPPPDDND